jgi:uncharacterized protein (TIGR03435 family)
MLVRVVLLLTIVGLAQASERPVFEAASVKPSQSAEPVKLISDPGLWSCTNCRLFDLFGYAYKVFEYQLIVPDWTKDVRFDVVAKLPAGVKPAGWSTKVEDDPFALMMQSLLEERFQIKLHREEREVAIYELRVAKGGHKMQEVKSPAPAPPPGPSVDRDGFPTIPGGDGMRLLPDRGRMQFRAQAMVHLAHFLATQVDRPVLDATGLEGRYALTLSWYRPSQAGNETSGPAIFEAVQKQLGLTLQAKRGNVETVVIDSLSRTAGAN